MATMTIDTTADLIAVNYTGSLGAMVRQEVKTPIFCQLASVDRREYYAAYDAGFRPEWRVTTNPINYSGQSIIDLETPEGVVRCDIYRTYRKAVDVMELWCVRKNEVAVQTFTLWTAGKRVTIFGAYLTGEDGTQRTETGKIATDTVTLVLPRDFRAFVGTQAVRYCRPKEYAALGTAAKAEAFCIDSSSFFALGDISATGKYQEINSQYDDVYRVQAVSRKNSGKPDTEYLEVVGK